MTLLMEVRYEEAGVSSVMVDVVVEASAEFAWDAVRDVHAVDTRLIPGFALHVEKGPGSRTVTFADDMKITERIVEVDDGARKLTYQATEGGPLTHHLGSQTVREDEEGVHLVWRTEFAPASVVDYATSTMRTTVALMKKTIETAFADRRDPS
ncbi:SRPBCC family protein [Streptomyces sp. NPDC049541]|uniref:SRPBCC family protein n=1 Tax=Streptomyces sp. NPDC049541 TaxID=3365594 RepID=UPI0037BAA12A